MFKRFIVTCCLWRLRVLIITKRFSEKMKLIYEECKYKCAREISSDKVTAFLMQFSDHCSTVLGLTFFREYH